LTAITEGALKQTFIAARQLADGRWIALGKLLFTTGLFVDVDLVGYDHRYCYETEGDARAAFAAWDGTGHPSGNWIKRKGGGGGDLLNPDFLKRAGSQTLHT